MGFGDFGNFNSWKPENHALNKLAYDEAHKKSSGPKGGNTGCFSVLIILSIIIITYTTCLL